MVTFAHPLAEYWGGSLLPGKNLATIWKGKPISRAGSRTFMQTHEGKEDKKIISLRGEEAKRLLSESRTEALMKAEEISDISDSNDTDDEKVLEDDELLMRLSPEGN